MTEYLSNLWTWTGVRVRQAHDARMCKSRLPPADPYHAYLCWAAWTISGSVIDFFAHQICSWSASDCTLFPNCCLFLRFSAGSSASPSPSATHWCGFDGYSVDSRRTHYWPLFCYHSRPAPGLRSQHFFSKDLIIECARFWIGHSDSTRAFASHLELSSDEEYEPTEMAVASIVAEISSNVMGLYAYTPVRTPKFMNRLFIQPLQCSDSSMRTATWADSRLWGPFHECL